MSERKISPELMQELREGIVKGMNEILLPLLNRHPNEEEARRINEKLKEWDRRLPSCEEAHNEFWMRARGFDDLPSLDPNASRRGRTLFFKRS